MVVICRPEWLKGLIIDTSLSEALQQQKHSRLLLFMLNEFQTFENKALFFPPRFLKS